MVENVYCFDGAQNKNEEARDWRSHTLCPVAVGTGQKLFGVRGPVGLLGSCFADRQRWDKLQAITSWTGQWDADGGNLPALWQMVRAVDPGNEWASINSGFDVFTRVT